MTALARITLGDNGTIHGTVNADLAGATAKLNIKPRIGPPFSLATTTGDDGQWTATYASDDFTETGRHDAEIEVTFSDGSIQTYNRTAANQLLTILVGSQIA